MRKGVSANFIAVLEPHREKYKIKSEVLEIELLKSQKEFFFKFIKLKFNFGKIILKRFIHGGLAVKAFGYGKYIFTKNKFVLIWGHIG